MSDRPQVLPTRKSTHLLEHYSEAELPTERGIFRVVVFRERLTGREHLAMVRGDVSGKEGVPVRLHSECLTSEVLGSLKCDCRAQLDRALDREATEKQVRTMLEDFNRRVIEARRQLQGGPPVVTPTRDVDAEVERWRERRRLRGRPQAAHGPAAGGDAQSAPTDKPRRRWWRR